jgi:hypothetical protein
VGEGEEREGVWAESVLGGMSGMAVACVYIVYAALHLASNGHNTTAISVPVSGEGGLVIAAAVRLVRARYTSK